MLFRSIRILPGTRDDEFLRERGLGDAGADGGPYGDLAVRVKVVGRAHRPPPPPPREEPAWDDPKAEPGPDRPRREEKARTVTTDDATPLEISLVEALLGGRIEFETPQGKVRVAIPPGTSSGTRMRLKAKGAVGSDGFANDLFLVVRIVVPKTLDDESRRLIEEFARLNPGTPRD